MKAIKIDRDIDVTEDPGTDTTATPVTDPGITSDWPTNLDILLENGWFKKDGHNKYVAIKFMLLYRNARGDPVNAGIIFLDKLNDPNNFQAIRVGAESSGMICGHSAITSEDHRNGRGFWVVEIYVIPPTDKTDPKFKFESLNIGLKVGPDPDGKYMPIYFDPKIKNDG